MKFPLLLRDTTTSKLAEEYGIFFVLMALISYLVSSNLLELKEFKHPWYLRYSWDVVVGGSEALISIYVSRLVYRGLNRLNQKSGHVSGNMDEHQL